LDALESLTGARLAPSARDVEGEGGGREAAQPGGLGAREAGADPVVRPEIGGRVRSRRGPDLALVHENDLGDALGALDGATGPRDAVRPTEPLAQAAVEHVLDEARFPRARDARDGDEARERDVHIEVPQIVGGRATDAERQAGDAPPSLRGQRDGLTAGE